MTCRLLAVLALATILAVPVPAEASHDPGEPPFHEQVAAADRVDIVLRYTHALQASYQGTKVVEGPYSIDTTTERARVDYHSYDVVVGTLTRAGPGEFAGELYGTSEVTASKSTFSSSESEPTVDWGVGTSQSHERDCRGQLTLHGEADGLRREMRATLSEDGKHVTLLGGPVDRQSRPSSMGTCRVTRTFEGDSETSEDGFTSHVHHTIFLDASRRDYRAFEVTIPLTGARETVSATASWTLPTEEKAAKDYCEIPTSPEIGNGGCRVDANVEVRLSLDHCAPIRRSYEHHLAEVRNYMDIEPGALEPWVLAWGEGLRPKMADVLRDERQSQLLGCDLEFPNTFVTLSERLIEYRDALLAIHKGKGLTTRGFQEVLGAERSLQLLGAEDLGATLRDLQERPPIDANLIAEVRSPVSLHAWSEDGKHVGWNAAKGAPDVEIEGATYTGAPNGHQRIVLPAGFYKIEVEELASGPYLLDVSWNGTGNVGRDEVYTQAKAGRTTNLHYAFDRMDANGTLQLDTFPMTRIATPTTHRFIDPYTSKAFGASVAVPTSGSPSTPDVAAPTGIVKEAPKSPEQEGAGTNAERSTPATATLLALAAVGVVALMRRRA